MQRTILNANIQLTIEDESTRRSFTTYARRYKWGRGNNDYTHTTKHTPHKNFSKTIYFRYPKFVFIVEDQI